MSVTHTTKGRGEEIGVLAICGDGATSQVDSEKLSSSPPSSAVTFFEQNDCDLGAAGTAVRCDVTVVRDPRRAG
ncbi:hypothetical protein [Arthrobacter sp. Soil764]|uniref:hypothetical protein n=1 Tax=Arthrobacter sp. Soil764 TaxID=1736403 RepID=UPI000AED297E|nr:hypothetical protein [Arthrobacter sp. Soil764]